jgi:FAD/FMN-containing dehydrogenase
MRFSRGTLTGEHGIGTQTKYLAQLSDQSENDEGIKKPDPQGILNPGSFLEDQRLRFRSS